MRSSGQAPRLGAALLLAVSHLACASILGADFDAPAATNDPPGQAGASAEHEVDGPPAAVDDGIGTEGGNPTKGGAGSSGSPATCAAGTGDCNQNLADGCEVSLAGDPAHCGACGNACAAVAGATSKCSAGKCTITCNDPCTKLQGGACVPKTWTPQTAGTTAHFRAVWGASPTRIWAAGDDGIYFSSGTGGWTRQSSLPFSALGGSGSAIYAGGPTGVHALNGSAWTVKHATSEAVRSLWVRGADLFVGLDRGVDVELSAGGAPLQAKSIGADCFYPQDCALYRLWGAGTTVFAIEKNVYVYSSPGSSSAVLNTELFRLDATGTWRDTGVDGSDEDPLVDVWGPDASNVYVLDASGRLRRSTNGGVTWATVTSLLPTNLRALGGSSGSDMYAVGPGNVVSSTDGITWTARALALPLVSVWAGAKCDAYAVGDSGTIVHLE